MSGIIDDRGTQWEHCNGCGALIKLDDLGYLKPTAYHKHGLDLCVDCADTLIQTRIVKFRQIVPAHSWIRK